MITNFFSSSLDSGCSGGDPPTAYQYVISAGGLEPESDYPYTAQDGNCNFDSSDVQAKISNWQYVISSVFIQTI